MTQQIINIGTSPGDGTGDTGYVGGQKINANFTEVYGSITGTSVIGNASTLTIPGTYTRGTAGQNSFYSTTVVKGSENNAEFAAMDFLLQPQGFTNTNASSLINVARFQNQVAANPSNIGGFAGIEAIVAIAGTTGNTSGNGGFYASGTFVAQGSANDNGDAGTGRGHLFGLNPNVRLVNGATFWEQIVGQENNIAVNTGASVKDKIGFQIVKTNNDAVKGSRENTAIIVADQAGASVGWDIGLSFGGYNGNWAMDPGGTLIGSRAHADVGSSGTTTNGVDFSNVVFTGSAYKSTGFSVDGSGNTVVKTILTTPIAVASLPAGSKGMRAFVTDANATTFASIVAAGGANNVPVYHDGTNWRIG